MIALEEIDAFVAAHLRVDPFAGDPGGVLRPASRLVRRLGLALEPEPGLVIWARDRALDALLLHRPWGVEDLPLAPGTGVLAYHLGFDDRMTLGDNPRLAEVCGLRGPERAPVVNGRVSGLVGDVAPIAFADFRARIEQVFGGVEAAPGTGPDPVRRAALMGAMTEPLVRWAAERGVDAYVTGQLRAPARQAVEQTGMAVIAIGHRRSEAWGMRALAHLLRERWHGLEVWVSHPG